MIVLHNVAVLTDLGRIQTVPLQRAAVRTPPQLPQYHQQALGLPQTASLPPPHLLMLPLLTKTPMLGVLQLQAQALAQVLLLQAAPLRQPPAKALSEMVQQT